MNIDITGLKFNLTPTIKEYVEKKLLHLQKFYNNKITEARVVLEVKDGHHRHGEINFCEIILRIPGQKDVFIREREDDMYKSINRAVDRAEKELKKIKGRTKISSQKLRKLKEYLIKRFLK